MIREDEMILSKYPKSKEYVDSHLVVPHRYCNRCGSHVLISDLEDYPYQCMYCDEDLYEIETHTDKKRDDEISDFDYCNLIEKVAEILCLEA